MAEKYLTLNLDDENAEKIAEILANKTARKILSLISENETLSQSDISQKLKIPLNTLDYNIKKLIESGLIEEGKKFFWSVKGKKIRTYKLANKKIVISTKPSKVSRAGILVSGILFGGIGFLIKLFSNIFISARNLAKGSDYAFDDVNKVMAESAGSDVLGSSDLALGLFSDIWIWIVCGAIIGVLGYTVFKKLLNIDYYLKSVKGGVRYGKIN